MLGGGGVCVLEIKKIVFKSGAAGILGAAGLRDCSYKSKEASDENMSVEAVDREAATSSRPCTPPQTSWFEFLLEESLLEKHLKKVSPG